MPDRRRPSDDARPIPTRRRPARPEPSEYDDDAYTVDTRGRRPAARPRPAREVPSDRAARAPRGARVAGDDEDLPRTRAMPRARTEGARPQGSPRPRPGDRSGGGPGGRGPRQPQRPGPRAPRPAPTERRGGGPRRWFRIVLALVVVWLVFLVATPLHAWNSVSRVEDTPAGSRPAETGGHTYLLVGSDSREGLTEEQSKELGTGKAEGKRTDSIMLVHVPSGGGKSVIISIPRDSYVPIPGHRSNKVNAAYAIGGPQLLVETLEQVTNLRIDGYLEIGFGGFASVVDSLGGVNICVPFNMDDEKAHINLKKGCQILDGKNALGFVRARYSDPRGDIGRAERQRQFLAAIMKAAATPSTVINPFRYWSFTHTAAGAVGVGQDTSMRDASRILLAMRGAGNDSTLSLTVPIQSTNYPTHAGIAVKWDTERAQALFTMLREDQPLEAPPAGTDGNPAG